MPKEEYLTLESLYRMKRGTLLERIADSTGWRQLEGSMHCSVDGEDVKITARLDCYDPEKKFIYELKSLELRSARVLPRQKDKLQVQCYGLIFRDVFSDVKGLKIAYLDMNEFRVYDVELEDLSGWVLQRVSSLHRAVRDSQPPSKEESYECRYCEYAEENCASTPIVAAGKPEVPVWGRGRDHS
jgi:CRISPR/Cas system-associated exonuclease Cas4 (RecB family)